MRPQRAAAAAAAFLVLFGASPAVAAGPASPASRAALPSVAAPTVSGGLTVSLSSGSTVHVQPTRGSASALRPTVTAATPAAVTTGNGISYHGGLIVPSEKVQAIYWAGSTIYAGGPAAGTSGTGAQDSSLVGYLMTNLAGSPYYNINATYGDSVSGGHNVGNTLAYSGFWADNTGAPASGASVSDAAVQAEIVKGFTGGQIAFDASTVYTVFSGQGVNLGGGAFTQYCAYHGDFTWSGQTVLYAVMPYDWTNPSACSNGTPSPNADPAADAEASVLVHELEEANTDPQLNAWYDTAGYENADKCAWNFGSTFTSGGGTANVTLGGKAFLIQQNWLNANGGGCALAWNTGPATIPSAPASPSASSTAGSVTVKWSAPASNGGATITGYQLYRATASGTETPLVALGAVSSYVDKAVTQGTRYYYTVAAINGVGTGAASAEVSALPGAAAAVPGTPVLTAQSSTRQRGVQLSWSAPSNGGSPITAYRVYRGTVAGGETYWSQLSAGSRSWRDTGTTSGVTYFYVVTAVNAAGEGTRSNEVSARAR